MTRTPTFQTGLSGPGQAGRRPTDVVFAGEPDDCDFCGRPMSDECFFADTELPGRNGRWGILCTVCTASHGIRPGWGRAQFYQRSKPTDPWTCQAGLPSQAFRQTELSFDPLEKLDVRDEEGTAACG